MRICSLIHCTNPTHVKLVNIYREDVYEGNSNTHSEVDFEKAAVLYNVGAIHSFLGTSDNRSTADGA